MSDALPEEIKTDFLNELKDYIPLLRDKADRLNTMSPESSDTDLTELHRLVHAICGASALIKLKNLSEVASEFEGIVEAIMSRGVIFDRTVFDAAVKTIDYFDAYAKQVPCNDAFDPTFRNTALDSLRSVNTPPPPDEGEDFLSQLLDAADQDENVSLGFDPDDLTIEDIHDDANQFAISDDELDATADEGSAGDADDPDTIDIPHKELLEGFYQEAEDHLQDLGKAIGQLEDRIRIPTTIAPEEKELLRLIRRSVHTIKGASAVVKLKSITSWGHEFENVLEWLYETANHISPDIIITIADATDVLESFVTNPRKVNPDTLDRLRLAFKQITSSDEQNDAAAEGDPDQTQTTQSDNYVEVLLPPQDENYHPAGEIEKTETSHPLPSIDQTKTIRIDLAKVRSLVNLGGELTIALSAFDQDMERLNNLIGEVQRTHSRLKASARDLELGYEGKAIGNLASSLVPPQLLMAKAEEDAAITSEFDLLELDRYSELNVIIRSLIETAADVGTIGHQMNTIHSAFKGDLHHMQILLSELNEKTIRMRMTPMSLITNRMRHTVRETATQLKKSVSLTIKGEHIELDKIVWDKLADPLMHLLRNAVDHGVETPEERRKAGKPEMAEIILEAAYQGNQVILRIIDDGGGINYDAIRDATIPTNPDDDEVEISNEELAEMIFQPGFSTRETVSEISGRGVGLDVVKENIQALKGSVHIEQAKEGDGTEFLIKLPLTMAVIKALIFDIGGKRYATPLYDIKEILRVNPKDLTPQADNTINVGGRRLPYYNVVQILGGQAYSPQIEDMSQWPLLLIIEKGSWQGSVTIDRLHNQKDIVIKNLGSHLNRVKGIAGSTVMGDGKVVPILNLKELIRTETASSQRPLRLKPKTTEFKPLEIMIVDDSVTIRNVVSRLMKRQGWSVSTAKDGAEAIEVLYNQQPDVIILDVEMPRMNGYEFMSSLRAQEKFNDLPVIMHTSRASRKHRDKARALGVNAFVTKPYEEDDFVVLVKRLGRKKLRTKLIT